MPETEAVLAAIDEVVQSAQFTSKSTEYIQAHCEEFEMGENKLEWTKIHEECAVPRLIPRHFCSPIITMRLSKHIVHYLSQAEQRACTAAGHRDERDRDRQTETYRQR